MLIILWKYANKTFFMMNPTSQMQIQYFTNICVSL